MKKIYAVASMLLLTSLLTACGLHVRRASELPPALHTLYLSMDNPANPTAVGLQNLLKSLRVHLVSSPDKALLTLRLKQPITSNSAPNNTTNSGASSDSNAVYTITYTQSVAIQLINNHTQQPVISKTISASSDQVFNRSQVLTANTSDTATQDLPREIVNTTYLWLTTDQVANAIHASIHPTQASTHARTSQILPHHQHR